MNGPVPFEKRNYADLNAVLVLPSDIPRNAAILIFLYIYFTVNHGKFYFGIFDF